MVAAEMLEEKRKKAEEEDMFDDIGAEAGQVMLLVVVRMAGNICEKIRYDTTSKMNLGRWVQNYDEYAKKCHQIKYQESIWRSILQAGLGKKKKRVPVIAD